MEHHITAIEAKAKEVHSLLLSLTADEPMNQLIKIIHGPGWTTPAEATFLTGILDAIQAHTKVLAGLQQAALLGASRVELNPQPLPPLPPPTEDINPQPLPPGRHTPTADFNPQPDPPGKTFGANLNPQPLPPDKLKQ